LMKAPPFKDWEAQIEAKKGTMPADDANALKGSGKLARNVVEYLESEGKGNLAATPNTVAVIAKYLVMADKAAENTTTEKMFEIMRPLGKGAFGLVELCFKKDTGCPFAVKMMQKKIAKQNKMIKDVLIEREVLAKMSSIFCVSLHYAYHDADKIALVLTLCPGGDLAFLLQQRYLDDKGKKGDFKKLPDGAVKYYGASMACGLEAIHKAGYVYRDLKPQNVLLKADGAVCISDMGLAADVSSGPIKQCSGTRGYWSPETIAKKPYTFEPDWWSLGVTMYVLFSDKLPFKGKDDAEKDAATSAGVIEFTHDEPEDLKKVVSDLCTIDMGARLGAKDGLQGLKSHAYFSGFNWGALESGSLEPPIVPNVNDINAPSKKDVGEFKAPKDVTWGPEDEKPFEAWTTMNKDCFYDEVMFRIKKFKELTSGGGGGGGGGCCVVS